MANKAGGMRQQGEALRDSVEGVPAVAPRVDPDAGLIQDLRKGVARAAEALMNAYADRVYRLAVRITGSKEDAEEVTQDTLWTVARKIGTFKGDSAFGSWLYRITSNAAWSRLRARRGQRHEIPWEQVLPALDERGRERPQQIEEPALQVELREVLTSAVACLSPENQTVFIMHDVEGMSNQEIAKVLGMSLSAVKTRGHRSRLFLRHRLDAYLAPTAGQLRK
jgi:RNA polymerase sigma-70 factor, ECF subfamily